MTLKQYLIADVVEQAIVLGVILPATGWCFKFHTNKYTNEFQNMWYTEAT